MATRTRRPRITYEETSRAPGAEMKRGFLPKLPSAPGFEVDRAFVMKAGRIEIDGQRYEFQDVRIILREKKASAE